MFTTYALYNEVTGKIYVGQTEDLNKRMKRHNGEMSTKKTSYTTKQRGTGIWRCVHREEFDTRDKALQREKQLKSANGRTFIHGMVAKIMEQ